MSIKDKVSLFYIPPNVDIDKIEVPKFRVKMKFKDFVKLPEYLQISALDNAEEITVRQKKGGNENEKAD